MIALLLMQGLVFLMFEQNGSENSTSIPLNGVAERDVTGACRFSNYSAYFEFTWNEEGNSSPRHTFKMDFSGDNSSWFVLTVQAVFQTSDPRFENPNEESKCWLLQILDNSIFLHIGCIKKGCLINSYIWLFQY